MKRTTPTPELPLDKLLWSAVLDLRRLAKEANAAARRSIAALDEMADEQRAPAVDGRELEAARLTTEAMGTAGVSASVPQRVPPGAPGAREYKT